MGGSEQAHLLRRPEREANPVVEVHPRHLLGDLEQGRGSRTVVVDAGAVDDRVEMSSCHHNLIRVAARGLGDEVRRHPLFGPHR